MVQVFSAAVLFASVVSEARACPYEASASTTADSGTPLVVAVDAAAASHCAKEASLVGQNCSYTTGMFARRVVEEGQDWTWQGALTDARDELSSQVAAPFAAEPGTRVIANELVETLKGAGHVHSRLALTGKLLDVDGVRYVVLTSFKVLNS